MIRAGRWILPVALLALAVIVATACGGGADTAEATPQGGDAGERLAGSADAVAGTPSGTPPRKVAEAIQAVLVEIDERDGQADHVVGKCVGCALMMDGSAEYTAEHAGYELHFCSAHCRDNFNENQDQVLLALDLAEPETE